MKCYRPIRSGTGTGLPEADFKLTLRGRFFPQRVQVERRRRRARRSHVARKLEEPRDLVHLALSRFGAPLRQPRMVIVFQERSNLDYRSIEGQDIRASVLVAVSAMQRHERNGHTKLMRIGGPILYDM